MNCRSHLHNQFDFFSKEQNGQTNQIDCYALVTKRAGSSIENNSFEFKPVTIKSSNTTNLVYLNKQIDLPVEPVETRKLEFTSLEVQRKFFSGYHAERFS